MSQLTNPYEIDILELFKILWGGKWILTAFMVLAAVFGFGYLQIAQPKYRVSVPFYLEVYPVICGNSVDCAKRTLSERTLRVGKKEWSMEGDNLILKTSEPSDVSTYEVELEVIDRLFASELYNEALTQIFVIETEIKGDLLATDAIALPMLKAKRLIHMYDSERSFILFGTLSIKKIAPNVMITLIASLVFGICLGCSFVIVRSVTKV